MTSPSRPTRPSPQAGVGRLCAEAIRNRVARGGLTLALLAAWSVSGLVVYVAEHDAVQANAAYTASMLRDGYATLLVERSDGALETFTWDDCNTLRHVSGARAVVGLREPVLLRLWDTSGPEMTVREAMGDVAHYLAVTDPDHTRRWVAPSLIFDVDALGARPADATVGEFDTRVVDKSGEADTRTAITASLTSLGGGFSGNAVMLAPPTGEIATCVVLSDLDRRQQVESAVAGLFPVGAGFGQRWALTNAERFDSPRDRYETRESRWYWLAAVALIAVSWAFSLWIIRSDLAVFAVAGLGARRLIVLTIAEMLVVAVGAGVIVTGTAMFDLIAHSDARYADRRRNPSSLTYSDRWGRGVRRARVGDRSFDLAPHISHAQGPLTAHPRGTAISQRWTSRNKRNRLLDRRTGSITSP